MPSDDFIPKTKEEAKEYLTNAIKHIEHTLNGVLGEDTFCFYIVLGWNAATVTGATMEQNQVISALYKSPEPDIGYKQLLNLNRVIATDPFTVASVLHNAVDFYINATVPQSLLHPEEDKARITVSDKLTVQ